MSEQDDPLARRYRELARAEPPVALDAAILAAARRAVAPRSFARRWGAPLSIAAVLVLAIGISLQVQRQEPRMETAAPAPEEEPAERIEKRVPVAPGSPAVQPAPASVAPPPAPASVAPPPAAAPAQAAPSPARAEPAPAEPAPAPAAAQVQSVAPPASRRMAGPPAAGAAPSEPAVPAPAAPMQPKIEASDLARPTTPSPFATEAKRKDAAGASAAHADPVAQLERIERLRASGRAREADEALAQFRRDFPAYRIPDATWERVRPR